MTIDFACPPEDGSAFERRTSLAHDDEVISCNHCCLSLYMKPLISLIQVRIKLLPTSFGIRTALFRNGAMELNPICGRISSGGLYGSVLYESENRNQRRAGLP